MYLFKIQTESYRRLVLFCAKKSLYRNGQDFFEMQYHSQIEQDKPDKYSDMYRV